MFLFTSKLLYALCQCICSTSIKLFESTGSPCLFSLLYLSSYWSNQRVWFTQQGCALKSSFWSKTTTTTKRLVLIFYYLWILIEDAVVAQPHKVCRSMEIFPQLGFCVEFPVTTVIAKTMEVWRSSYYLHHTHIHNHSLKKKYCWQRDSKGFMVYCLNSQVTSSFLLLTGLHVDVYNMLPML